MFRSSATSIQYIPLTPTQDHNNPVAPHCSLLKLENLTLLLDCGSDLLFSDSVVQAVQPHASSIDAILLSSSELSSCGSLAMVLPLLRPGARVYATMATARIGVMNVTSHFLSKFGNADNLMFEKRSQQNQNQKKKSSSSSSSSSSTTTPPSPPPENLSIKSIYSAFRAIREVHFDQLITIVSVHQQGIAEATAKAALLKSAAVASAASAGGGKGGGNKKNNNSLGAGANLDGFTAALLSASENEIQHAAVRAVSAGRVVGGSGFRIRYRDDDIAYLPRFTPRNTFCLPGINPDSALLGANILLCDGSAACVENTVPNTIAGVASGATTSLSPLSTIENVLKSVRDTLRKGGSALLPLDALGVGIEVMHKLEQYFTEEAFAYPLVFASPKAREHVERLRLLSEFALTSANWNRQEGPMSTFRLVSSPNDLASLPSAKCVVLHTHNCNDALSCALLQDIAKDSRSSIIFTDEHSPTAFTVREAILNTLNNSSFNQEQQQQQQNKKKEITIRCNLRTILEGEDLEAFLQEDKKKRDAEEALANARLDKQRQVEAVTEVQALTLDEDEADDIIADVNENNKQEQQQHKKKQQQLQHPSLFIAKPYEVRKRVKPDVLNFPGDLSLTSTRILKGDASFGGASSAFNTSSSREANNTSGGKNNSNKGNSSSSSSGALNDGTIRNNEEETSLFGIPLTDNEVRRLKRFAAEAAFSARAITSLLLEQQQQQNGGGGEEGASSGASGSNYFSVVKSAETIDEIPAFIRETNVNIKLNCKVETHVTTRWLDGTSLRVLLRNHCNRGSNTVRKIAFLNTDEQDARALINFCEVEKISNSSSAAAAAVEDGDHNNGIFCPRFDPQQQQQQSIELATAVFSCEVRVHPKLLASISKNQKSVTTSSGSWKVAWVHGLLVHPRRHQHQQQQNRGQENQNQNQQQQQQQLSAEDHQHASSLADRNSVRRPRGGGGAQEEEDGGETEHGGENQTQTKKKSNNNDDDDDDENGDDEDENALPTLCPIDDKTMALQKDLRQEHNVGSIYVGELKLPHIERDLVQRAHLRDVHIELDDQAPLLVAGNAVAIRGGDNTVAMEAVPGPAMFAARKAFKSSFSHIL